jgi:membrane protein required for colicin V production
MLLDVFVIVVAAISTVVGILRGFVREVMTIVGVGGGIAIAWLAAPALGPTVAGWLGKPDPATLEDGAEMPKFLDVVPFDLAGTVGAWALIIAGVLILTSLISHLLAEAVKATGLGPVDGGLGAIFGAARGLVIVLVLYLPVAVLADAKLKEEWLAGGASYGVLEAASGKVLPLLPGLEEEAEEGAEPGPEGADADAPGAAPEEAPAPEAQEGGQAGTGQGDAGGGWLP